MYVQNFFGNLSSERTFKIGLYICEVRPIINKKAVAIANMTARSKQTATPPSKIT